MIRKLSELAIPYSVINWISVQWGPIPCGVPQGTQLGPWLFILLINDLKVTQAEYIDDSTASEIVPKHSVGNAQNIADTMSMWSIENRMQLDPDKCKELKNSFNTEPRSFDSIVVNGQELEVVTNFKLLGLNINNKLIRW